MTESDLHKMWKRVACGCEGAVGLEVTHSKGRTDCINESTRVCAEVQFSRSRIPHDILKLSSLKSEGKCEKLKLIVKNRDYELAQNLANGKEIEVEKATMMDLLRAYADCYRKRNVTSR